MHPAAWSPQSFPVQHLIGLSWQSLTGQINPAWCAWPRLCGYLPSVRCCLIVTPSGMPVSVIPHSAQHMALFHSIRTSTIGDGQSSLLALLACHWYVQYMHGLLLLKEMWVISPSSPSLLHLEAGGSTSFHQHYPWTLPEEGTLTLKFKRLLFGVTSMSSSSHKV